MLTLVYSRVSILTQAEIHYNSLTLWTGQKAGKENIMSSKKLNTEASARIEAENIDSRPFTVAVTECDAMNEFLNGAGGNSEIAFTLGKHEVKVDWKNCKRDKAKNEWVEYSFEDVRGDFYGKFTQRYYYKEALDRYGKNRWEWFKVNIGKQCKCSIDGEPDLINKLNGRIVNAWYMEAKDKNGNYYKFWQFNDPDAKDYRKHQVKEAK